MTSSKSYTNTSETSSSTIPEYLGIHRTDDLVIIQIVAGNWRDTPKKKALFKAITDNLARDPGLRQEDVLIVLSPNARDEWYFGNGVASYVTDEA
jgi:phenylpyruvate tautomerase PptA (4-oxalocrotonate tautomerase family)